MRRLTGLLVIALVAGPGYVRADDAKKTPAADAKKDAPKDAAKDAPKDAAKDASKEAKEPAKDAPKDTSGASAEVKVGTGVENHEIVGEAATFPTGTTVWVWSRVVNGEGNVKHVWKRDGKDVWTATLPVGSKRWSTQSRRAITTAGSWSVDVQTEAGASIGTVSFTIQ
ncbi:MAG TPA: DUF2914 domain-containing protein [Kofleriaceae bacterium]